MNKVLLDEYYWNNRYEHNQTAWDIGAISTPLKTYIDQLANKDLAILIPGCGNAYEAKYLLQQGFNNITLIDVAPSLTAKLALQFAVELNKRIKIITGDFFLLADQFDLIIEQTFFCALHPNLRPTYAKKMAELLAPNGQLVGLLFNQEFEVNPPFGGNETEYRLLFAPYFEIKTLAPCYNSIAPRAGKELFMRLMVG